MNVDRYKKDLDELLDKATQLLHAIQHECSPQEFARVVKDSVGDRAEEVIQAFPSFKDEYQPWYSEAKALIRQLLPDRLSDFTRFYEKPKSRKDITYENYTIEDYLEGLVVSPSFATLVGPHPAISRFRQQLSLVKAVGERFRSSLFDIRQLAQADLFDSELDAAKELAKNKFNRAAGVVAGVVLERHLKEICSNHSVTTRKKLPKISDLNDALKGAECYRASSSMAFHSVPGGSTQSVRARQEGGADAGPS